LTVPVGVLQSNSICFTPRLPQEKHDALQGLVMGPVLKVLLLFEERFWPHRFSALFCGVGPVTLYWNVFYASKVEAPVLCAYCTGPRAAALTKLGSEDAMRVIVDDLRTNFCKALPRITAYRWIDWSKDAFACGGYSFARPGTVGSRAKLAASTGKLFWAGSETATLPIAATVEGAFTSGLRAAEEALKALGVIGQL
jgi:monoamine oxidase